jgi:hypothetical protein
MLTSVLLHEVPASSEVDRLAHWCARSERDWGEMYLRWVYEVSLGLTCSSYMELNVRSGGRGVECFLSVFLLGSRTEWVR